MGSHGSLVSGKTQPASHAFSYRQKTFLKKKKIKALNIAFDGPAVSNVTFVPPDGLSPKAIPVTPEQLQERARPAERRHGPVARRWRQPLQAEAAHL